MFSLSLFCNELSAFNNTAHKRGANQEVKARITWPMGPQRPKMLREKKVNFDFLHKINLQSVLFEECSIMNLKDHQYQ